MTASVAEVPHPLDPLSAAESNTIRQIILDAHKSSALIKFRTIALDEPPKHELVNFLELEHSGRLTAQSPRPARVAKVQFDVIRKSDDYDYVESWVDLTEVKVVKRRVVDKLHQAGIVM